MRRIGVYSLIAIGALEIFLLFAFGLATPLLVRDWHQQTAQSMRANGPDALGKEEDAIDKEVTHLEQSVVIMLGFSALTIAILFGSIVFGEYRINRSVEDLENRAREVKERFPRLAEMEQTLRRALDELEQEFRVVQDDWPEDRYGEMEIEFRQHILTAEPFLPLLDMNVTPVQLRGMANFFFSKYNAERVESDLDRALYYAVLALERGKGGYQYKNDLGFIYMDLAGRSLQYRRKAKAALSESKRKNPSQQRCYYNLGLIHYQDAMDARREGDSGKAREELSAACEESRTALRQQNWESKPNPKLASAIHYNLACFLSRLAELEAISGGGPALVFDQIVSLLQHAAKFRQTKPDTVRHDLESKDGDLFYFSSNPDYADRVQAILISFTKTWST